VDLPLYSRYCQCHGRNGKDVILVETVGVGQDEVEIVNTAHTSIVVLVPGMGTISKPSRQGLSKLGTSLSSINVTVKGGQGGAGPPYGSRNGQKERGWLGTFDLQDRGNFRKRDFELVDGNLPP